MSNRVSKKNITCLVAVLVLMVFSNSANAQKPQNLENDKNAVLYTNLSLVKDNDITIDLMVNPKSQAINAVGVYLNYSTSTLQIKEIDMSDSFCELVIEKSFDIKKGSITIMCGLPTPGIDKDSEIAKLIFEKNKNGWIDISILNNSMVLANDGKGTNLLKKINNTVTLIP